MIAVRNKSLAGAVGDFLALFGGVEVEVGDTSDTFVGGF